MVRIFFPLSCLAFSSFFLAGSLSSCGGGGSGQAVCAGTGSDASASANGLYDAALLGGDAPHKQNGKRQKGRKDAAGSSNGSSNGAQKAVADVAADDDVPEVFPGTDRVRIVSYNVENLFDTADDPLTNDDEFTPQGRKHWTQSKYSQKLANVSKAILLAGCDQLPNVVALVEVENRQVLCDLVRQPKLKPANYQIVHKDSPDSRGIDVALLFNPSSLRLLSASWRGVKLPTGKKTRDILHAVLAFSNGQHLHMLVNHWPSMMEGEEQSEPNRIAAAKALKSVIDSVRKAEGGTCNFIVMGDFNSKPERRAISQVLNAMPAPGNAMPGSLYNLMSRYFGNPNLGTHKYGGRWDVLDHVIVDGLLLDSSRKVFTTKSSAHICHERDLLFKEKNGYFRPNRSFKGDAFTNGFSDHLPVSLDVFVAMQ